MVRVSNSHAHALFAALPQSGGARARRPGPALPETISPDPDLLPSRVPTNQTSSGERRSQQRRITVQQKFCPVRPRSPSPSASILMCQPGARPRTPRLLLLLASSTSLPQLSSARYAAHINPSPSTTLLTFSNCRTTLEQALRERDGGSCIADRR